ncbi:hypothetical protein [Streptomyces sp. NPDC001966]
MDLVGGPVGFDGVAGDTPGTGQDEAQPGSELRPCGYRRQNTGRALNRQGHPTDRFNAESLAHTRAAEQRGDMTLHPTPRQVVDLIMRSYGRLATGRYAVNSSDDQAVEQLSS